MKTSHSASDFGHLIEYRTVRKVRSGSNLILLKLVVLNGDVKEVCYEPVQCTLNSAHINLPSSGPR